MNDNVFVLILSSNSPVSASRKMTDWLAYWSFQAPNVNNGARNVFSRQWRRPSEATNDTRQVGAGHEATPGGRSESGRPRVGPRRLLVQLHAEGERPSGK